MTYSFNRVKTAALKSLDAMTDRLANIAGDFADVDMFLVGEAEQCIARLKDFQEQLQRAEDPFDGERRFQGYTLQKVRALKRSRGAKQVPTQEDPDLFAP